MIRILGIDPGASGGIAEIYSNGIVAAYPMPDDADLREILHTFARSASMEGVRAVCFLELVSGYIAGKPAPGSAMFNFGDGYGYIRGLLAAFAIETHLVRPQTWQAGIPGARGVEKPARKRALKEHAARLFPSVKVTFKTADALCIAAYGLQQKGNL